MEFWDSYGTKFISNTVVASFGIGKERRGGSIVLAVEEFSVIGKGFNSKKKQQASAREIFLGLSHLPNSIIQIGHRVYNMSIHSWIKS